MLNLSLATPEKGDVPFVDPGDFVRRFCSILDMSHKAVKAAQEAVEKTAECDIRRNPATVAATIIYMITQLSDERKLVRNVADATGVAQGTISNSYKDMYKNASRLVPAWYANEEDLKKLCIPKRYREKIPHS
ncbi:hypothetical protein MKW98_013994 [Papaver atlanticum]|uniref:Transcription factor TFIIB cyclin-like domain-containing protein n=1 Tax=Papaver atlanticum TaxID=357466 RepID=A0AAD4SIG0_9MAGN|nr:hypothetical protein MKW98_013994 [Papaver atlanticum]